MTAGPASGSERLITIGEIAGVHGVRGWLKIFSWTEPREKILEYTPWRLKAGADDWREVALTGGRRHGNGIVARLDGIEDADAARRWIGADIAIERNQLPAPEPGEFYWVDLEGLRVENANGERLGRVKGLRRTGAHDVLVMDTEPESLIPFVMHTVVDDVDFTAGIIRVNWDTGFAD